MPALNYAEQYSTALANAYPYVLNYGALWNSENKDKYEVVDGKTIKIPTLSTGGRVDGSRDSIGTFSRNFDNDWETKELTHHRMWQTLVHPKDIDQTNQVASIQKITKTMNETEKFPEMDAYLISRVYTLRNAQEVITPIANGSLTKDNILAKFDELMAEMDEAIRHFIKGVFWQESKAANVLKSGLTAIDSTTIFIYQQSPVPESPAKDILVKGCCEFDFDNTSQSTISESLKKLRKLTPFVTVSSIDNCWYGGLPHYEISAK